MRLILRNLLTRWSKKTPQVNNTASTTAIENSHNAVKTVNNNPYLFVSSTDLMASFIRSIQKKNNSIFLFIGLNRKQSYFNVTSNVLGLWLFFLVVIQERVTGGDAMFLPLQVLRI
jgi:hypothetical protein